jgi:amino acid adenylation domain-containing protein
MVVLAAFQVLLSRHGAGDDVVVGSPIAGRTRRETEGLIGFFVNTLVMRTDLSGDPDFREVLRRVRQGTLGAYEHQDVPFEKLVEELQPERSLSHAPLFQVLFTMDTTGGGAVESPAGLRMEGMGTEPTAAKVDLSLAMSEGPDGLGALLQYNVDLWERGTAERMLARLVRLLEQVAADADRPLSGLALLSDEERAQVVDGWNATDAAYPSDATLHGLIEAQAARTPDAVALRWEDDALTYAELNARANQLAHHLVRLGVGPETRVGLCLERGVEMVVCLLAVLKAGGAYVPVDPGYPADRIAYMLADSGVPVLLTQERLRAVLPATDARIIAVDAAWDEIAAESPANVRSGATPRTLAYVIYTSGSTGRPKGVMNQHGAVVNRLAWMQAEYGLAPDDVVLQKTPFSFDVSVWEFLWPLQQGAMLVMARPDGHRDPAYLADVIQRRGVTTLHFVPSMLQTFVESVDADRCASLKRVLCSGEALPPALVDRFHARFPESVGLHNLYGPTEAAVDVSYWPCARGDATGIVPIGRPVWNTRLYVLDAAGQPAPVGVPGELHIGGVQVARGYHGRPSLTAERFVPDPFSATPGARLYRTGDRARWVEKCVSAEVRECGSGIDSNDVSRRDAQGHEPTDALTHSRTHALEFLGRLDAQVKIRGFRIEPGEIEAALATHPDVRECAVLAREDAPGDPRLVAYVVGDADEDALRAHLGAGLPEHMVPSAFVTLDALPLTPNGKLDRRALPAPEYGAQGEPYVAPRTPTEAALAAMWTEVLRVERVGIHDNFFRLGGHSLLAVRIMGRIRDTFGVQLPLRALFEVRTIAALAGEVDRTAPDTGGPAITAEARVEDMMAGVDGMSEEELDRLLGDLSLEEELEW